METENVFPREGECHFSVASGRDLSGRGAFLFLDCDQSARREHEKHAQTAQERERFVEYEHVQPFMDDIEQMEKDLKLKKITAKYIGEAHEEKN